MLKNTLINYLCEDCSLPIHPIQATLSLFEEKATIPFIARYRKEKTDGLDETQLRQIQTRYDYYLSLFARQETILKSIEEQGKLTSDLKIEIEKCRDKQTLEDIYLPYKIRRKTKADIAIKNGLGPLADLLLAQNSTASRADTLSPYITDTITTTEKALEGALHIIAQTISDTSQYRQWIRTLIIKTGFLTSSVTTKSKNNKTKFDMYYNFSEPLRSAASHRLLAIRRGEKEKILNWKIKIEEDQVLAYLQSKLISNPQFIFTGDLKAGIKDAFTRLINPSLQTECFNLKCEEAENTSINVFSQNLKNLLMAAPVGSKVIMGIDPGFRTGCKIAIVDKTGLYKSTATIFPTPPYQKIAEAEKTVLEMAKKHQVELIAIGNGTASKETMQFIKQMLKSHQIKVTPVIVNESGASVYSASEIAIQEYPNLDITVRGAISIAHRLQDPLAELVKIDPKSIGVGQYQHDVNQQHLKEALTFTTELAVNTIGVDVNTSSQALLTYISGIGPTIAKNIVKYREENGQFKDRKTLMKVSKLGPKAYEQCIGFLRIKDAKNPLDNSAIHPESYPLVQKMAKDIDCPIDKIIGNTELINQLQLDQYITETVGLPTLQDIAKELQKPGVDPRAEFVYANFDDSIDDIADLKEGMSLEGVVTNVTNFGAFVDIGVHQDGLIHVSKLSNSFVKNPQDIIAVGEKVLVTVLKVDLDLKRIQLARVI
jgi:protein Tex